MESTPNGNGSNGLRPGTKPRLRHVHAATKKTCRSKKHKTTGELGDRVAGASGAGPIAERILPSHGGNIEFGGLDWVSCSKWIPPGSGTADHQTGYVIVLIGGPYEVVEVFHNSG